MKIKSQKDFFSGVMFLAVGVAFAVGAGNYTIGSGARMGPGYFPMILGVLMSILGIAICFSGLTKGPADGDKIGKWAWRQVFFVLAANFAFGILLVGVPKLHIPQFGLIVAIYALTFVASMAEAGWKFKTTFTLATVLAVGSYLAFVVGLKLQFPVWPAFISA